MSIAKSIVIGFGTVATIIGVGVAVANYSLEKDFKADVKNAHSVQYMSQEEAVRLFVQDNAQKCSTAFSDQINQNIKTAKGTETSGKDMLTLIEEANVKPISPPCDQVKIYERNGRVAVLSIKKDLQ